MPALLIARIPGNPKDVIDRLDRHSSVWNLLGTKHGLVSISVVTAKDEVLMIETWASAEDFEQRLSVPAIAESFQASGLAELAATITVEGPFEIARAFPPSTAP